MRNNRTDSDQSDWEKKGMKLESLTCNHCGGPLQVPDSANFVTCNHCGAQLAVRRTQSATFTEELGEIRSNQEQMMEKLAVLERQNRLAQIDREWEIERESFLTTTKNGRKQEPSELAAVLGGIIAGGFGLFWSISAFSIAGGSFGFFGLLFILFGVGMAIYGYQKAKDYRAAQRRYRRRRSEALEAGRPEAEHIAAGESIPTPDEYLNRLGQE